MSYGNPYQKTRKPKAQHITRMFEATVLDDPGQRAKLVDLVRKDLAQIDRDNQLGILSTWHLDLRNGPYLAWGLDAIPGHGANYAVRLVTREYPDPTKAPEQRDNWVMVREMPGMLPAWGVERVEAYAAWRALQSPQPHRPVNSPRATQSRGPDHEYEPGE